MLNPSRLSSLISSTSFPLNRCPPSSGSQCWGYTTRPRGWGIFKRHYGDFCTGAESYDFAQLIGARLTRSYARKEHRGAQLRIEVLRNLVISFARLETTVRTHRT